ncbi:MAG: hypothetical protein OSJ73_16230 [Lachnospiraceae bacterium]|nr:hypothetical protein [Lachnospiraceae bacterium]
MNNINMKIYALYHIYDDIVEEITYKQIKRIDYFKTKEECKDIIKVFKTYVGFRDYPESCFKIFEYEVGKEYWRKEFLP